MGVAKGIEPMANYKAEYSKAVLEGVSKRGMSEADIAQTLGRSRAFVQNVLREEAVLSDGNLESVERAMGTSAGMLALLSVEDPDPGLVAVMEAWAATRFSKKVPAKHVKKSAASR
jgi:cyanate lyase